MTPARVEFQPVWAWAEAFEGALRLGSVGVIEARLVGVERWGELRRERFVRGCVDQGARAAHGAVAQHGPGGAALSGPPRYARAAAGSKLDPFKAGIDRLPGEDAAMTGRRIRELIAPRGFDRGKAIVDDYVREVRPAVRDGACVHRKMQVGDHLIVYEQHGFDESPTDSLHLILLMKDLCRAVDQARDHAG